jgi:hypothetical protein
MLLTISQNIIRLTSAIQWIFGVPQNAGDKIRFEILGRKFCGDFSGPRFPFMRPFASYIFIRVASTSGQEWDNSIWSNLSEG